MSALVNVQYTIMTAWSGHPVITVLITPIWVRVTARDSLVCILVYHYVECFLKSGHGYVEVNRGDMALFFFPEVIH